MNLLGLILLVIVLLSTILTGWHVAQKDVKFNEKAFLIVITLNDWVIFIYWLFMFGGVQ